MPVEIVSSPIVVIGHVSPLSRSTTKNSRVTPGRYASGSPPTRPASCISMLKRSCAPSGSASEFGVPVNTICFVCRLKIAKSGGRRPRVST